MTTIYYTRHGLTEWNKENKTQGRFDIPLSIEGREQAEGLKKSLALVHLDKAYSSPLCRAYETAEIALQGRKIEIVKDPRLLEINYGDIDGKSRFDPFLKENSARVAYHYPHGENYFQAACRIYSFFDERKEKEKGKNILVVGHQGISRIVYSYFHDRSNEEFFTFKVDNCQLMTFVLDDGSI